MALFYIDFDGYCIMEAATKEEAEQKFWDTLQKPCDTKDCYDDIYDIDSIQELKEE